MSNATVLERYVLGSNRQSSVPNTSNLLTLNIMSIIRTEQNPDVSQNILPFNNLFCFLKIYNIRIKFFTLIYLLIS